MKIVKLLCVFCLTLIASAAVAPDNNGATIIDEFGCIIQPADSGLPISLYTEVSHSVTN